MVCSLNAGIPYGCIVNDGDDALFFDLLETNPIE